MTQDQARQGDEPETGPAEVGGVGQGTTGAPETTPAAPDPVRDVLRQALVATVWLVAVLAVVGSVVGWFVAGAPGVWGALLGAGIALVFCGTTLVTTMTTSKADLQVMTMVVMGAWLAKMLVLVVVFALLRGADFYHLPVFVVVLLLGVAGSFALDFRAIQAGRVPHVDPGHRAP